MRLHLGSRSPGPLWEGPDTEGHQMPKLNPTKAAEVKKAGEEGAFPVFPVGLTKMKLADVTTGNSRAGDPMWTWEFRYVEYLEDWKAPEDAEPGSVAAKHPTERYAGKTQKYYTVLRDDLLWDLDNMFAAFDSDPDTDTDDLIGDEIVVMMDQAMIEKGQAKGQMGNNITRLYTLADGEAAAQEIQDRVADQPKPPAKKAAKSAKATPVVDTTAEPDF